TAAESRGRGAAVFAMAGAEGLARERGAASVRVDTHPGNVPMQRLLGRCGYVRCGIILIGHAEGATPERVAFEKLVWAIVSVAFAEAAGCTSSCRNSVPCGTFRSQGMGAV